MDVNDENIKLEKVIKSCKAAKVCSKVIFMIFMVATVLTLISGIVLIADRKNMDDKIKTGILNKTETGSFKKDFSIGGFKIGSIDDGDVELSDNLELESSVPSLQKFFDENKDSYSLVIGIYLLGASLICLILTFAVWLISTVFDIILKEGNPFADNVPKRILTSMIILTVIIAMTSGIGFAVLLGITTWAVYTIMDYGKLLRIQSDETL